MKRFLPLIALLLLCSIAAHAQTLKGSLFDKGQPTPEPVKHSKVNEAFNVALARQMYSKIAGYFDSETSDLSSPVGGQVAYRSDLGTVKYYDAVGATWRTFSTASTSPGGSSTQVQFNDSGAFGGNAGFTFTKPSGTTTGATAISGTARSSASGSSSGSNASAVFTVTGPAGQATSSSTADTVGGVGAGITLTSGAGGSHTGAATISGDGPFAGNGGIVDIIGGGGGNATSATGTVGGGNAGSVELLGGNGGTSASSAGGNGSTINLHAGDGGVSTKSGVISGSGGPILITAGNGGNKGLAGAAGDGGGVTIDTGFAGTASGGASAGLNGAISIGTSYARSVSIGNNSITTAITGSVTKNGVAVPSNSAGANVVPKSDGTNLAASQITDNGSAISIGSNSSTTINIGDTNHTLAYIFAIPDQGQAGIGSDLNNNLYFETGLEAELISPNIHLIAATGISLTTNGGVASMPSGATGTVLLDSTSAKTLVCSNTAASTAITGTASKTYFNINCSIPANTLAAGKTITLDARGVYSAAAANTIVQTVDLCKVSGCGSGTVVNLATTSAATPGLVTNQGWLLNENHVVYTAGATGTGDTQGYAAYQTAALVITFDPTQNTSTATIDTTAQQYLSIAVTWSSNSGSNTISLRNFKVVIQ